MSLPPSNQDPHHHHQQQQQQSQQPQPQPLQANNGVKKKLIIDRMFPTKDQEDVPEIQAYQEMLDFERRLDSSITRKTLDIRESMKRPARIKKTLRIFVTNLFYTQDDGIPSWELRVGGRLTEDSRAGKRKFSSFFKSLVIELDSHIYGPDNHLIEWHRTASTSETDGYQVRRYGELPVKCTILFQLEHQPPHYKIDPRLARLLGKKTDSRPAIINALWQYIKTKTLQDSNEREYINNDKYLKQIFECKRMKFSEIPFRLNCLLSPPDPIVINHAIIRGVGEMQRSVYELDVEVEDKDNNKDSMSAFMMSAANVSELQQLDEKICDTLKAIKLTRNTFDLFTSFAEDPHQFTNRWLATQSSDISKLAGQNDQPGDSEEERRAEYYYQPWLQEAVCRYFYRKVQERRGDLEVL